MLKSGETPTPSDVLNCEECRQPTRSRCDYCEAPICNLECLGAHSLHCKLKPEKAKKWLRFILGGNDDQNL